MCRDIEDVRAEYLPISLHLTLPTRPEYVDQKYKIGNARVCWTKDKRRWATGDHRRIALRDSRREGLTEDWEYRQLLCTRGTFTGR